MNDTAQPEAAETDAFNDAALAFKVELGQAERKDQERDEKGRFAPPPEEEQEQTEDDAPVGEQTEESEEGEAADDAQPEPVEMPKSWAKEDGEIWETLPVEAQARIAERETQRDHAVNQKFQEAANARKAYEAFAAQAHTGREEATQIIDQVMGLLVGSPPPASMLDPRSSDYNPDQYHLHRAQYEQANEAIAALRGQREAILAQAEQEAQRQMQVRLHEINQQSAPAFIKDVPDAADPKKVMGVYQGLIEYALQSGAPADVFEGPLSAMEWHVLWKAQQWDAMQSAKVKANATPAPQPRKASPPVRPGVTTPRSAIRNQQRNKNLERLRESGSIEDGAAVFKDLMMR